MFTEAIEEAYVKMKAKGWDTIYFAIDIHDTIAPSTYTGVSKEFYPEAVKFLQFLSEKKHIKIILFSSCHKKDQEEYINLLAEQNIKVDYFNENPEVPDTLTGCFSTKFYYDILLDDKAGFRKRLFPHLTEVVKECGAEYE
jgi:hypothetical protein